MALNLSLRMAIYERHMAQADVAQKAGIDITKMSKIANGRLEATDDEKKAIARILRKPIDELFPNSKASAA